MKHKPVNEQVIVAFGASSGIGRAFAVEAARRGAAVLAVGRDREALESLSGEAGREIGTTVADAAEADQVRDVAELALSMFGRIDTWAHIAGVAEYARFEQMTPEEFRRVIDVDLLGPVWGARAALPHLRASHGAFVVVSSEVAKRGFPLITSYSAAKHGVDGFLEALRVELRTERVPVTVTQIMPAAISTPFFEHARTRLGVRPSGPPPVYPPEKVAAALLDAAEHGGRDTVVGSAARMKIAMQRMSPHAMDFLARAGAKLQKSREPKGAGDDALFDSPEGDSRTRGVVTTTHR